MLSFGRRPKPCRSKITKAVIRDTTVTNLFVKKVPVRTPVYRCTGVPVRTLRDVGGGPIAGDVRHVLAAAPKTPGDAVVNVVYADVLEVGEARRSTQVGQIEKSMDRSIRVDKIVRRTDREE